MKHGVPAKITGAGQGGYCIAFIPESLGDAKEKQFENVSGIGEERRNE